MAAFSAILYGVYTIVMKKQVGDESRVNMALFFGLVGFINTVFLWPCLVVLHLAGWETFEMPPTGRIWLIVIVCFSFSFFSKTYKLNKLTNLPSLIPSPLSSQTSSGRMPCS